MMTHIWVFWIWGWCKVFTYQVSLYLSSSSRTSIAPLSALSILMSNMIMKEFWREAVKEGRMKRKEGDERVAGF